MIRNPFTANQTRSLYVDKELGSLTELRITNTADEIAFSYHAQTYRNIMLSAVIIDGKEFKVKYWYEAIQVILSQLKKERPKLFKELKDDGLLNWVDSELKVIIPKAITSGAPFSSVIWSIRGLQWLIRMMGINLERVRIRYGQTTVLNNISKKRGRKGSGGRNLNHSVVGMQKNGLTSQGETVVCALCGAKVKFSNFQQHLLSAHKGEDLDGQNLILPLGKKAPNTHSYPQPQVVKQEPQNGMVICKYCGAQLKSCNVQRHLRKVHNGKGMPVIVSYPQHQGFKQSPEKIYTVVNGEVIRLKNEQGEIDHTIARSSSDSEDTWIGMGHLARDNGRFGSIIGEDYAD